MKILMQIIFWLQNLQRTLPIIRVFQFKKEGPRALVRSPESTVFQVFQVYITFVTVNLGVGPNSNPGE